MMTKTTTLLTIDLATMAVLAFSAFVTIPMQEASASLVNINGNKVLSNNQNKGKGGNNNCLVCIGK